MEIGTDIKQLAKDMQMPKIDNAFVIDFLKGLEDFKVNNELPFGTCDYYYISAMIEFLKDLKEKEAEK